MRKVPCIGIGLLILSATAAVAQTPGNHPVFDRLDTDKSGSLSVQEVRQRFPRFSDDMFKQADADHDGKLSLAEWQTFAKAKRAERNASAGMK